MASSAGIASKERLLSLLRKGPGQKGIWNELSNNNSSTRCREKDVASMDHFSPVAPAHVRVLVLPVGEIESSKFTSLVRRLQQEASIVPLAEVESRGTASDISLTPTAFPQGSLLYRFSATAPSDHHEKIAPYEFFREPLVVLGIVDGLHDTAQASTDELARAAAYLRERHPRVVHRQLIVLDNEAKPDASSASSEIRISHAGEDNHASLRSAVTELSARFLVEFTTYAKAVQASPTIQTPGQTAKGLQRQSSLRESDRRPGSGHGDSQHVSSPSEDGRLSDSSSIGRPPPMPATSFDQMPSANNTNSSFQRRESEASAQGGKSKSRARSSSQDRTPAHSFGNLHGERFGATGFGQSSSQEKTRARGKARVGIVMGSIYMMAGQWSEALRLLAENTTISHALTDHLWHAKGLENMLVCMMLLLWSDTDFKIPKICDLAWDKVSASKFSRVTSNSPGVPRESAESAKDKSLGHRLSVVAPGLARKILTLLRSVEGSLELPFLVFAEASVRIAKLLATLNATNGELTCEKLQALVIVPGKSTDPHEMRAAVSFVDTSKPFSRSGIAEVLNQALPSGGDLLATSDHIRLLAGIAAVYSMIGFDRKKAMTINDAITRLTGALMQARKLGAAEMGIHPAASLSTDTGADTLLAIAADGSGLANLMADISNIYGAASIPSSRTESPMFADTKAFGNPTIKFEVLRALAGFCEAAPDPQGVLLMTSLLLRAAGPNAAIDIDSGSVMNAFSREEQMHLATVLSRTVAVSKNLGLADVLAVYWDPFLVRGVEVLQSNSDGAVIDRHKAMATIDQPEPGNPLLYDPNAGRPGTAVRQVPVLVQGELSEFVITLQNPFDIPIDIEELRLVTDGLELLSNHAPTTLGPLRIQRVSLMARAASVGAFNITGCRIKMQGCVPQVFPIVSKAWSAKRSVTAKQMGLDARPVCYDLKANFGSTRLGIQTIDVPVAVIEEMPTLVLESSPELDSGLMLLEGERHPLVLRLRNLSAIPASVFAVTDSADIVCGTRKDVVSGDSASPQDPTAGPLEFSVPAGAVVSFPAQVEGRPGTAATQVKFFYRASGRSSRHARVASVQLKMTVNAALQVQNMEILHPKSDLSGMFEVFIDVRNAWPRPVSYKCGVDGDAPDSGQVPLSAGQLAPGEVRRIHQIMSSARGAVSFEPDVHKACARFFSSFRLGWSVDSRSGNAYIQDLPLSLESLLVLRAAPIDLSVTVANLKKGSSICVDVGSFVLVRVMVSNRGKRSAPLKLRLVEPRMPLEERRFAVVGQAERTLVSLDAANARFIDFVVCPLVEGFLEMDFFLHEMHVGTAAEVESWYNTVSLTLLANEVHAT